MIFELAPSKHARHFFIAMHVAMGLAVIVAGASIFATIVALVCLALHGVWQYSRLANIAKIKYESDQWFMYLDGNWVACQLHDFTHWRDALMNIEFTVGWRRYRCVIWPDSLTERNARHLRILLKHRVDMSSL